MRTSTALPFFAFITHGMSELCLELVQACKERLELLFTSFGFYLKTH